MRVCLVAKAARKTCTKLCSDIFFKKCCTYKKLYYICITTTQKHTHMQNVQVVCAVVQQKRIIYAKLLAQVAAKQAGTTTQKINCKIVAQV